MRPLTLSVTFIALFSTGGCKSSGPSKEELDKAIDQRLLERGLAPLPVASASAASSAATDKPKDDPVSASIAFLARLDELMKDYKPELPVVEDKSDLLRCVTTEASSSNPDIKKVMAATKGRVEATKQERRQKEKDFYDRGLPLAFHYDIDWKSRKSMGVEPVYGCFNVDMQRWLGMTSYGGRTDPKTRQECLAQKPLFLAEMEWKVRTPGRPATSFLYSGTEAPPAQPPELMRRMDAAGVKPPARLSCRVDDVLAEQGRKAIKCRSSAVTLGIRVPGDLRPVNVGDVVSVPIADVKREPDGVLFKQVGSKTGGWIVDADGATVTIDQPATCPTVEEITSVTADAGGKP